jgi:transcriptional regulator with XRE-family HTH domain
MQSIYKGEIMAAEDLRRVLSVNLKRFRKRYALAQAELAEKADISTNFLSDIETCKKWPFPETLVNLSKALHIEVYELFLPKENLPKDTAAAIAKYSSDAAKLISHFLENLSREYTTGPDRQTPDKNEEPRSGLPG